MEAGENNPQQSSTAVSTESLLQNDSINDNASEKEALLEPNMQEAKCEHSSVTVPKSDDSKSLLTETAVEKDVNVVVHGRSSESIVDHDGSELITDEVVGVEESDRNRESSDRFGFSAIEGETDTAKMEEDVPCLLGTENVETVQGDELVTKSDDNVDIQKENVETVLGDELVTKSDDNVDIQKESVETVLGDESITEGQDDVEGKNAGQSVVAEEEGKMADEDKPVGDTEIEEEEEGEPMVADEDKTVGAESPEQQQPMEIEGPKKKRKRGGKTPQNTVKPTGGSKKTVEEEDVCFICYDGGDLVICDKRDCPKAYHPSCINREEAFFQTKGLWNCGWHLCSICAKKAEYMCYTCTFSVCKSCIKTNVILRVREKEKKGFCESCMKIVMFIEKNSQENQEKAGFNNENYGEYLFKDYWIDMKAKLDISVSELDEAKNVWKGSKSTSKREFPAEHPDGDSGSENPSENLESQTKKTGIGKSKKPKTQEPVSIAPDKIHWASKELLEFVAHMGKEILYRSQFDVQAFLLEYIKTNKLRDSRRKGQIICDARLQGLFGKPRVGHFEMLELLESHFLINEEDDIQGSVVDTVDDVKTKDKKRKNHKKGGQECQSNRQDYAAIDTHNINLIYLRQKLVEDLLDDSESFRRKIAGTFVRIRISGANPSQDIYRLVQVTGTTTTDAHYAVGKKTTDIMLEILNVDKTESISIDTISNQKFTKDECKRLRQSIKCGLINRLTVGDILDKAIELQATRVDDWLETEVARLNRLRDRASDLGRKKEFRECVVKLEVLKRSDERARRLQDIPVIHDDPTMDPKYESEDDTNEDEPLEESWRGTDTSTSRNSRNPSNNFSKKVEDAATFPPVGLHNDDSRDQRRERVVQTPPSVIKKPSSDVSETEKTWHYKDPTGETQGPFSMKQLRKWNNGEFFPVDLKIWRTSADEKDGILLTDALEGQFTVQTERHGFASLPSPTPNLGHVGPHMGLGLYHEGLQSPTPNGTQLAVSLAGGGSKEPNAMVQRLAGQNAYGWSGDLHQNQQPNQWAVRDPTVNFLQQQPPPQPIISWPTVGSANQAVNWGTVNHPWDLQTGTPIDLNFRWVPPQPVLGLALSQGWVADPTQVPIVSGNGTPGEVVTAYQGWPRGRSESYNSRGRGRGRGPGFTGNGHLEKPGSFDNRGGC